ncbi:hypothetical protein TeGR_g12422, partial [Tetraparma gracilis]
MNYHRNHPAVTPHEFHHTSKTVRSTMDTLDKIRRDGWKPRDASLERRARRLRGTYGVADITQHPELRTRLAQPPGAGSLLSQALSANANVVADDRGFFPDGSRPGGHLPRQRGVSAGRDRFARPLREAEAAARAEADPKPFYPAGKATTRAEPAYRQDNTLAFDAGRHASIQLLDDPLGGTEMAWPSLGGEALGGGGRSGVA